MLMALSSFQEISGISPVSCTLTSVSENLTSLCNIGIDLIESSPWAFLVSAIFLAVLALWSYATYLEFDYAFSKFCMTL